MPSREAKVYLEAKLKKKQQENKEKTCFDCGREGHAHKGSYLCPEYNAKKRKSGKDDYETKQAKDKGKKRRLEAKKASPSNTVICKHCGLSGHSTKASFACQQHITTKAELLRTNYSDKYELYARKLPLVIYVDGVFDAKRSILRKEHEGFQQKVIELCRFIRDVTTRAQLFMNYYIIKNRNLTVQEYIYEQNFWYCICKLVLGQKITNKAYINHTVALTFDDVATDDPSIISPFKDQKIKGYSDAMAAACESIATTYMNHMVENFTKRIRYYLYWALKPTFQETKNNVIYGLIDSYCLPKILYDMDTCKWLEDVDITKQPEVDATCQSLMKKMPSTPTIENITAAPSTFLPPLAFMLQLIETKALTAGPNDKKPKLFSLTPTVSFKWKHVSINEKALCCLSRQSIGNRSYANNLEIFFNVFNFAKFGYETLQDLVRAPANSKDMFNCVIHTDGFAVTFLFVRSRQEKSATATLTLEDFTPAEINKYFMPIAVDPGRNEIFTAVVGYNTDTHQIRACSKEERAQIAGYNRRTRVVDEKKVATGIKEIETNLPTCKTVHSEIQYKLYLSYVLRHIQSLHEFYGFNSAKFIFNDYQGRQRADEELANMLLDGGKKYNPRKRKKTNKNKRRKRKLPRGSKTTKSKVHARKAQRAAERKEGQEKKLTINVEAAAQKRYKTKTVKKWTAAPFFEDRKKIPLVIFGDGMKNKDCVSFKGHPAGVTGKLYRTLLKRQRCFLAAVVDINEFKTSKVCNNCNGVEMKEVRISDGSSVYGTKACKTCGMIWQRDVNAAKNMLTIANSVWEHNGRPDIFSRHRHNENGAAGSIPTA